MAKTLNDLTRDLKDYLVEVQSDAHNAGSVNKYRYNNLKVELSDPRTSRTPLMIISIGMSEAAFNITTGEKASGGLGPDERYVIRWFDRGSNREDLKTLYQSAQKQVGKVSDTK